MRKLARILLVINFVLLIALAGPGSSRQLYLAEEKADIAHTVTFAIQFWFIAATAVAAILFVVMIASSQRIGDSQSSIGLFS